MDGNLPLEETGYGEITCVDAGAHDVGDVVVLHNKAADIRGVVQQTLCVYNANSIHL